ncbi:MAG: hypothetical protein NNA22_11525, partial [Nitrospira sp.]|nr:hypothetical protein [Nitrospira sp.]
MRRRFGITAAVIGIVACWVIGPAGSESAAAPAELTAPKSVHVFDTPNDGGGSLTVVWPPAAFDESEVRYQVLLGEAMEEVDPSSLTVVAEFPANTHYVRETKWPWWTKPADDDQHVVVINNGKAVELKNGVSYAVAVAVVFGEQRVVSRMAFAVPEPNWFNWNQSNNLFLALLFGGMVFVSIGMARRREMFLRRIPGLDAVDEAIGRATELGKPVLYLT